jgi:hypothetical protein
MPSLPFKIINAAPQKLFLHFKHCTNIGEVFDVIRHLKAGHSSRAV